MGEDLTELLLRPRGTAAGGSIGREADWLELFAEFPVTGNVLIADASYIPAATDGLSVALPVGTYRVLLTVLDYGEYWRVARLRLTTSEQARRGPLIGRTWTDVGRTAVCDLLTLAPRWGTDQVASYAKVATWFESGAPFGVALFGESDPLPIPFVDSGFGDGEYPVSSLVDEQGRRMGFEVRSFQRGVATRRFRRSSQHALPRPTPVTSLESGNQRFAGLGGPSRRLRPAGRKATGSDAASGDDGARGSRGNVRMHPRAYGA